MKWMQAPGKICETMMLRKKDGKGAKGEWWSSATFGDSQYHALLTRLRHVVASYRIMFCLRVVSVHPSATRVSLACVFLPASSSPFLLCALRSRLSIGVDRLHRTETSVCSQRPGGRQASFNVKDSDTDCSKSAITMPPLSRSADSNSTQMTASSSQTQRRRRLQSTTNACACVIGKGQRRRKRGRRRRQQRRSHATQCPSNSTRRQPSGRFDCRTSSPRANCARSLHARHTGAAAGAVHAARIADEHRLLLDRVAGMAVLRARVDGVLVVQAAADGVALRDLVAHAFQAG